MKKIVLIVFLLLSNAHAKLGQTDNRYQKTKQSQEDPQLIESAILFDELNNEIIIEKYQQGEITIFIVETPEYIYEIHFDKPLSLEDFIKEITQNNIFNEYLFDALFKAINGYKSYIQTDKELF